MLLKNEISFGRKCLSLAVDLRDECLRLRDDARDRRKAEEEEKRKEKEKEEKRKIKALMTPDMPDAMWSGTGGGVGSGSSANTTVKKKTKKAKKAISMEDADGLGDIDKLVLDEEKTDKVCCCCFDCCVFCLFALLGNCFLP